MSYRSTMYRGPLGLVLKISRIVGMAPYKRAPEFRVSRTLAKCGKIFVIINGLITISLVAENFRLQIEEKGIIPAGHATIAIFMGALVATNVLGVFTAPARLTRMAHYIQKLNQFDKVLNKKTEKFSQNNSIYKTLVLFGGFIVFTLIDYEERYRLYSTFTYVMKILNAFLLLNMHLSILLLLQIIFFAKTVNSYLMAINDNLQQLLSDGNVEGDSAPGNLLTKNEKGNVPSTSQNIMNHRNNGNRKPVQARSIKVLCKPRYMNIDEFITANEIGKKENILGTIRELATLYQLTCEIVLKTSEADGPVMLLFLAFVSSFIEIKIYIGIVVSTSDVPLKYIVQGLISPILYTVCGVAFIVFFVEQFHQTHSEMERTHCLIQNRKPKEDDVEMEHELELFHRMIILNKVKYSPLDLCTIDRELVMKLFSGIITFMVITLQYGPETRNLFLNNSTLTTGK